MNSTSLRLMRWSYDGSPAGRWMVRGLPGAMVIYHPPGGWRLAVISHDNPLLDMFGPEVEQAWGKGYQSGPANQLRERHPKLELRYPTRRALLGALQAALDAESPPSSVLAEVLA